METVDKIFLSIVALFISLTFLFAGIAIFVDVHYGNICGQHGFLQSKMIGTHFYCIKYDQFGKSIVVPVGEVE